MREPIKTLDRIVRVAGIDSGFATLGLAIVEGDPRSWKDASLLHLVSLVTKKADKKARKQMRVCTDDVSRIRDLAKKVGHDLEGFGAQAIAVEWFTPNPRQGGFASGGWKAAITVGALLSLGWERRLAVLDQLPLDVKALVGSRSASKQDVEDWLRANLAGFSAEIDKISKTHREHAADAAAHALIGLRELGERREAAAL